MLTFEDADGNPGKLEAGCQIIWYPQRGFFMMKDAKGRYFKWDGSEKHNEFFSTPRDFVATANFLASLYGLDTRHPNIENAPTWVEFVKIGEGTPAKTKEERIQVLSKETAFSDNFWG